MLEFFSVDRTASRGPCNGMQREKSQASFFHSYAVNRSDHLMVSVSGIRGTIPEGLDPVNITLFTQAFAAITGKRIVIGQDARPSGPFMKHLIVGTLLAAGKEVTDIGLAPTPTVKAAVKSWKADAGIMISASHNPTNWNAFKFIDKGGGFFNARRFEELDYALKGGIFPHIDTKKMGAISVANGIQNHILSVLDLIPNVMQIKKKKYRVVVDGVAGAGREALPELLRSLGCEVVPLYCEATTDGSFPRPPEPTPAALKKFSSQLKSEKAAVGFALDPDADRLVVGSGTGGAIHEEYTVPLALLGLLSSSQKQALFPGRKILKAPSQGSKEESNLEGTIVVNLSTSDLVDSVAEKTGLRVVRSPVGEANVVEVMQKKKAVYGGEGNGGVIHPRVPSFGRDTLTGAALILSAMAAIQADSVDELMEALPPLHMKKTKAHRGNLSLESVYRSLSKEFPGAEVDNQDGLHLRLPDLGWIHARPSNTEPIIRLIAQGKTKKDMEKLIERSAGVLPA